MNSLIGSLVIEHTDHSSDGLLEKLRDSELLDLTGPETTDAADPLNNVPFLKANPVSDNLKSVQGRWREPLTLLLLSLAIYQIVRGDIMAPALPLLWYALELIVKKDPGL
ncbi:MAG: hypothetical protein KUF72_01000 [Candidatus Thiodiazotropha sp. (ex Ctena orbiculata)]|nr:hypothetical protein [Candidatus Thiodiazotropha taylori]